MKTKTLILWAAVFLSAAAPALAADPASQAFQNGLVAEEANHDLATAIKDYQSAIADLEDQRKLMAIAVFRLAECDRKLSRTNEANVQYQRILQQFPDQAQLARLSREYLGPAAAANPPALAESASGAPPPIVADGQTYYPATNDEATELRRVIAMTKDSPDLVSGPAGGVTPLELAANRDQIAVARFLLAHGADASRGGTMSPLTSAVVAGHKAMTELLISHGADVNTLDPEGRSPLQFAAADGFEAVAEVLLAHGADVNSRDEQGETPLFAAVRRDFKSMARLLLTQGAEANARDKGGKTPLFSAIAGGFGSMVDLLLAHGANINAKTDQGWTPLHEAIAGGHLEIAKLLLSKGANTNAKDKKGETPLYLAARNGRTNVATILLEHGANPNAETSHQDGPLFVALRTGDTSMVKLLLDHGADPNVRDSHGNTPLALAVARVNAELVKLLIAHGAEVNVAVEPQGWVPQTLLNYANLFAAGPGPLLPGMNPIIEARRYPPTGAAVLRVLREHGAWENSFVLFVGEVKHTMLKLTPGKVITLLQGLKQVGLKPDADLRRIGCTSRSTRTIDVEAIKNGHAKDIPLGNGDVVWVPAKAPSD